MASGLVGSHYALCSVLCNSLIASLIWFWPPPPFIWAKDRLKPWFLNETQITPLETYISAWKYWFCIVFGVDGSQLKWPKTQEGPLTQPQPDVSLSSNQSKLLIRRPCFSKCSAACGPILGSPEPSLWSISSFLLHSCLCHVSGSWKTAEETSLLTFSLGGPDTQHMCPLLLLKGSICYFPNSDHPL